jgi:hypothetical protein
VPCAFHRSAAFRHSRSKLEPPSISDPSPMIECEYATENRERTPIVLVPTFYPLTQYVKARGFIVCINSNLFESIQH